jgi:hypothetical protein
MWRRDVSRRRERRVAGCGRECGPQVSLGLAHVDDEGGSATTKGTTKRIVMAE